MVANGQRERQRLGVFLRKINTGDRDLELIQANVDESLKKLEVAPLTGGNLLADLALATGSDNLVQHGLGYTPSLILVFAPSADAYVWSPTSTQLAGARANATYINLRASAACVASVWVK